MNFAFLIFLPLIFCTKTPKVRYDGFKVFRVIPKNEMELQSLNNLRGQNQSYNFWSDANYVNQSVDIMVPPNHDNDFKSTLGAINLNSKLLIEDVQTLINNESPGTAKASNIFDWTSYHTLEEIYKWLTSLSTQYPDVVTLIQGGRTYQERNITGVKISFKEGNKAVFLEGGIHAREWISPATVTYILNEFLTSTDPNVRFVAESHDWYVFPVVNPDGYAYTRINRLWRKTRKWYGFLCFGADPNRNWDYKWMHGGSSDNPCEDTFAGNKAFSEIETKSLSEFIDTIAHSLKGYISFHSYSQMLLLPFGHDGLEVPENNDQLLRIGRNAATVLAKRYGTEYKVGNIPDVIYVASGGSTDWVLGKHRNIKFVYTYELRDTGENGFLLPPEQIIPTGEETLDSVVSIIKQFQDEENLLK